MSRRRIFRSGVVVLLVVMGLLMALWIYSTVQLQILKTRGVHSSPADGMYSLVFKDYHGVKKIEVVRVNREIFDRLRFVEVYVWAQGRSDGKSLDDEDYDNPGEFFVRVRKGWVFVPEGRFPHIVALGQWLLGLS